MKKKSQGQKSVMKLAAKEKGSESWEDLPEAPEQLSW